MGKEPRRLRQRRQEMVLKHPYCHWCGRRVREYASRKDRDTHPCDMATVDHLYSKIRGRPNPGALVLACSPCNQWRADEETEALGMAELWRRSGRGPGGVDPYVREE